MGRSFSMENHEASKAGMYEEESYMVGTTTRMDKNQY
jgi:hypothetical protein